MFSAPKPSLPDDALGGLYTWLIEHHLPVMKRLMLMADLGEIDVEPEDGDKRTLDDITRYWAEEAVKWPLRDTVHGIEVGEWLSNQRQQVVRLKGPFAISGLHPDQFSWVIVKAAAVLFDNTLRIIPKQFLTDEIIDTALTCHGRQIAKLPVEKITSARMLTVINRNPENFKFIPTQCLDDEIIDLAISKLGENLLVIPIEQRTEERTRLAVKVCPWLVSHLDADEVTPDIAILAVSHDGLTLDELPISKITRDVCRKAVEQDAHALPLAPERFINSALLKHALQHHPQVAEESWFQQLSERIHQAEAAPSP